ncbi:MAG: asparagine synthase C-terminal domain-containing protein, partial [Planctomycetaceae bacterium]
FADSSQIPTFLVAQLARQDVTVSLSGDGGDELYGGYDRYFQLQDIWERYGRIPGRGLLSKICRCAAGLTQSKWKARFEYRSHLLGAPDAARLYQHGNLHWQTASGIMSEIADCPTTYWQHEEWLRTGNCFEEWMWLDAVTYLPDDILVKVDRASMAVGLEVRVPLLDHRVVDYAWRLPLDYKVDRRSSRGKLPLRALLGRYVPDRLFDRPKQGFGVPIDAWLRGPLRDWAEELLDESQLRADGFFNPAPVRREWEMHQSGQADRHYLLWDVLMFNAWLRAETC